LRGSLCRRTPAVRSRQTRGPLGSAGNRTKPIKRMEPTRVMGCTGRASGFALARPVLTPSCSPSDRRPVERDAAEPLGRVATQRAARGAFGEGTAGRAPRTKYNRWWVYVIWLIGFNALSYVVATKRSTVFGYEPFSIPSSSMSPTVEKGDFVLSDTWRYRNHPAVVGEIVIVERPERPGAKYIKRGRRC